MPNEKITATTESEIRFFEGVRNPALKLKQVYESQQVIVEAARDALITQGEGVIDTYQDLFIEAESVGNTIDKGLSDILDDNVAHTFAQYHTDSLTALQEDARRYQDITNELIKILDTYGYQVMMDDEVITPDEVTETEVVDELRPQPQPQPQPLPVPSEPTIETEPEEVTPTPVETVEVVGEPTLLSLYQQADARVLKTYNPERGKEVFKKLDVIVGEIKSVLQESHFEQSRIDLFMREVVGNICFDIKTLNQKKAEEADKNNKKGFNDSIKAKYKELLDAVAGFMQTEKVDEMEGLAAEALPQMTHEDVDEQLVALREAYAGLKEQITDRELVARIDALLDVVDRYSETDVTRQVLDKTKYIEKFTEYLREAKEKMSAQPVGSLEEDMVASVPTHTPPTEAVLDEDKRRPHLVLKADFKKKEKAYKEAMDAYYQDDSLRARLRSGAASAKALLGLNAELPEHLELQHREYKELRAKYAKSLDLELIERARKEGNKEYFSDSNATKAAFGTKFILKPGQEFLALQERSVLTPEQRAKVQSALQFLAKHKWTTRAGMVALAGVAGAVSGGATMALAGAGVQAGKIATSFAAGAGAGFFTKEAFQGSVDAASHETETARASAVSNFSLADLDKLEQEFVVTKHQEDVTRRRQKIATVGAGVLAGGFAGYEFGAAAHAESTIEYKNTPEVETITPPPATTTPEPVAPALSEDAIARQVAAERASMAEVPVFTWSITEITVPYEGLDNTKLSYETVLSDVKVVGTFSDTTLTTAERSEVDAFLKLKAHDLLSVHPNISESKLEADLFEKLQGKFSGTAWWGEAKVTGVDIGGIAVRPVAALTEVVADGEAPDLEITEEPISEGVKITIDDGQTYTEATPYTEQTTDIYTVQKGDTLYAVAEKQFAAKLAHLSPIERGELLDTLFSRLEQYPELKDSLGLRSGDVDLIYPEEKLNLSGLEAELAVLLERREILEQFKNSAPLSVEADSDVKNIPITVVEKPVTGGVAVETIGKTYTEAVPQAPLPSAEVMPPPRPFALNGQFADQPVYKEYIQSVFGSAKAYEQAVERAVQNFDKSTYDVFENSAFFGGNTYESPYRLLGEMSLAEVTEFEKQQNSEIRSFLNENNIKYDTYLAWLDKIDEMIKVLPYQAETKVSDLFARYVVEVETPKSNTLIK